MHTKGGKAPRALNLVKFHSRVAKAEEVYRREIEGLDRRTVLTRLTQRLEALDMVQLQIAEFIVIGIAKGGA